MASVSNEYENPSGVETKYLGTKVAQSKCAFFPLREDDDDDFDKFVPAEVVKSAKLRETEKLAQYTYVKPKEGSSAAGQWKLVKNGCCYGAFVLVKHEYEVKDADGKKKKFKEDCFVTRKAVIHQDKVTVGTLIVPERLLKLT